MRHSRSHMLAALIVCVAAAMVLVGAAGTPASGAAPSVPAESVTVGAAQDNTLYQSATGALSNGAGQHLFVGRNNGSSVRRALVAFDVAAQVPLGSTITSASLVLHMSKTHVPGREISLHRVSADWGEGASDARENEGGGAQAMAGDATWLHAFFNDTLWAAPGGDFTPTESASETVGGNGLYTWGSTAEMVADVQGWLDAPDTNHGWLLQGEEAMRSTKRFDSRENTTASRRPVLTIEYVGSGPTPTPTSLPDSLVAPGATVEKQVDGFSFTEGPAVDAHGWLFFSDVPESKIYTWSPDGQLALYREDTGRANGLYFDARGRLVACEGGNRRLTRDDRAGNITALPQLYAGKPLNSPNDLWIHPDGGIYFSDPRFGATDDVEQDGNHVYLFSPARDGLLRVTDDLTLPNGLIGTPDGSTLYVTDSGGSTWRYTIAPDGTLEGKTPFAPVGGDGMTLDEHGNAYVAGDGVHVFAASGDEIETIQVPERPSNVTFGGPEGRTLFITARTSLYAVEMTVRGAYAQPIAATPTPPTPATPTPVTPTPTDAVPTPMAEAPEVYLPYAARNE